MNLLVVTPTYNERDNLPVLAAGVLKYDGARMLIVDDGSPDGTGAVADQLAKDHPGRVEVMHRTGQRGLGRSYVDGLQRAIGDTSVEFICQMDADLSHNPEYLPEMVRAAATQDLVIGSRYLHGVSVVNWGLQRLILSVGANAYARTITGLPLRDCTSGFQCIRREVLEAIGIERLKLSGYSFLIEVKYRAFRRGFRLREAPIVFTDRKFGYSKITQREVLRSVWAVWALRLGRDAG
jgi:dolichol-phosphate mannosyltransferase